MPGYGAVFREREARAGQRPDPDLIIERLSEEHATVGVASGSTPLEPGDCVRILPNHSCVVTNLVNELWLVDHDRVEALPVAARGKIQ